ncbi:MAG: DUF3784 domain-containing protein [Cyclobacteriaceae bacterium]
MTIVNFLVGAFLIGLGFLVKSNPDLIAGYNTMSEEKRKNVDIDGLSTMMRNCLVAMGGLLILIHFLLAALNMRSILPLFMIIHIFSFTCVMVVLAQNYDKNKKSWLKKYFGVLLVVGIALFVGFKLYYDTRANSFKISNDTIIIEGAYAMSDKMTSIDLIDSIPKVEGKVNGLGISGIRKGTFRIANWGNCQLYIESANGPFILVKTSGKKIIINQAEPQQTKALFDQLTE